MKMAIIAGENLTGVRIMQKQFSIAEAKNKLPSIIHWVEKGPYVELTRRGKPVAVLMSIQEYERLTRKYGGFWSKVTELRGRIEKEGIDITDEDFNGLRDLSSGRKVQF